MALVLGVKVGDVVDVADNWIRVQSVDSDHRATLVCSDGRRLAVRASGLTYWMPNISVGLGPDPARSQLRLIFEAPKHVPITRRRT